MPKFIIKSKPLQIPCIRSGGTKSEHSYLLSGDFEHIQGIVDAPFLAMNDVIYFNERVKEDRRAASQKMIAHLKNKGNLPPYFSL